MFAQDDEGTNMKSLIFLVAAHDSFQNSEEESLKIISFQKQKKKKEKGTSS